MGGGRRAHLARTPSERESADDGKNQDRERRLDDRPTDRERVERKHSDRDRRL